MVIAISAWALIGAWAWSYWHEDRAAPANAPLPAPTFVGDKARYPIAAKAYAVLLDRCPKITAIGASVEQVEVEPTWAMHSNIRNPRQYPRILVSVHFREAPRQPPGAPWTWDGEVSLFDLDLDPKPHINLSKPSTAWLCDAAPPSGDDTILPEPRLALLRADPLLRGR